MTLGKAMTVYLRDPYTEQHFEIPEVSSLRAERNGLMRTQQRLLEQIEEGIAQRQLLREELQEARRSPDLKTFMQTIKKGFSGMTPQQRRVFGIRCGLDGGTGATLREIAEREGLTKERIRQIEYKAFRELKEAVKLP